MPKIIIQKAKSVFLKGFGRLIKKKRIEKGLSQKELAKRCHSYLKKVQRIEKGEYDFKMSSLIVLAKGLDVSVHELFNFEIPQELLDDFWIEPKKTTQ